MIIKDNWPTASKLERLRIEGVLPYSSAATSICTILTTLLLLSAKQTTIYKVINWHTWININTLHSAIELLEELAELILTLAIVVFFVKLIIGLLQNLFYFKLERVAFKSSRFSFKYEYKVVTQIVVQALMFIFAILIGVFTGMYVSGVITKLLEYRIGQELKLEMPSSLVVAVVLVSILLATLCVLWAHFSFRWKHRMTSEEIKNELAGR